MKDIYTINKNSQSNGSLMRITPLAAFIAETGLPFDSCTQLIKGSKVYIQTRSHLSMPTLS